MTGGWEVDGWGNGQNSAGHQVGDGWAIEGNRQEGGR